MRLLLATDSFPPVCGGSGWSTYELARGLRARGHTVIVAQPRPGAPAGRRERDYDGLRVLEFGFPAPSLPYVRNYFKNERLYPAFTDVLSDIIEREQIDLVHGQHVLTGLPAIEAAHRHRPAGGLHRSRLLARLLLVRSDLHPQWRIALPRVLGGNDDALHPASRWSALAAGAADDSLHARQPRAKAIGPRRR